MHRSYDICCWSSYKYVVINDKGYIPTFISRQKLNGTKSKATTEIAVDLYCLLQVYVSDKKKEFNLVIIKICAIQ